MAGGVRGQVLFDTAQVGNLFQVAVHFLIAGNGQQSSFIHAVGVILILFKYLFGNAQKRDVTEVVCLFTGFHYPQVAVTVLRNVFGAQIIHVYECQPGIYAKDKNIPVPVPAVQS